MTLPWTSTKYSTILSRISETKHLCVINEVNNIVECDYKYNNFWQQFSICTLGPLYALYPQSNHKMFIFLLPHRAPLHTPCITPFSRKEPSSMYQAHPPTKVLYIHLVISSQIQLHCEFNFNNKFVQFKIVCLGKGEERFTHLIEQTELGTFMLFELYWKLNCKRKTVNNDLKTRKRLTMVVTNNNYF